MTTLHSYLILSALLFAIGLRLGRYVALSPLLMAVIMAGFGASLVGIVMALGG